MKSAMAMAVLVFGMTVTGCSNTSCKDGCDKLDTCGYKSSGLSCDTNCEESACAACISDTACNDIPKECAEDCPGVSFTK